MLKKIILGGIIGFSFLAVIPQGNSAFARPSISRQVTVSGPGGMCRTVRITLNARTVTIAQLKAKRAWTSAAAKVKNDYRTTHRVISLQGPYTHTRPRTTRPRGYQGISSGRVCFAKR